MVVLRGRDSSIFAGEGDTGGPLREQVNAAFVFALPHPPMGDTRSPFLLPQVVAAHRPDEIWALLASADAKEKLILELFWAPGVESWKKPTHSGPE